MTNSIGRVLGIVVGVAVAMSSCGTTARGDVHVWYELAAANGPGAGVVDLQQGVRGGPLIITRDATNGSFEFVVRCVADIDATTPLIGYSVDLIAPAVGSVSVEALTYLAVFDISSSAQLGAGPGTIIRDAGQVTIFGALPTGVVELFEFVLVLDATSNDDVELLSGIGPSAWATIGGAAAISYADASPLAGNQSGIVSDTPSIIIRAAEPGSGSGGDCDDNGVSDVVDIANDPSRDCDANGRLDVCDLGDGAVPDCDGNGMPDSCDLASGASLDCNMNGVPDECDLATEHSLDCDENGIPDECDIVLGGAADINDNGVPDACESSAPPGGSETPDPAGGQSETSGGAGTRPGVRPQPLAFQPIGRLVNRSTVHSVINDLFGMDAATRRSLVLLPIDMFGVLGVPASLILLGVELSGISTDPFFADLAFAVLDAVLP